MTKQKIYIVGCAKTGTTLILRLFHAFKVKAGFGEISLKDFIKSDLEVAKRTHDQIMSNILNPEKINEAVELILKNNIKLIYVRRGRKETLKSSNNYVTEKRYDACLNQFNNYRDLVNYIIDYEKLLKNPDKIQKEIADLFKLEIVHKWSEYPKFITWNVDQQNGLKLRKIGESY